MKSRFFSVDRLVASSLPNRVPPLDIATERIASEGRSFLSSKTVEQNSRSRGMNSGFRHFNRHQAWGCGAIGAIDALEQSYRNSERSESSLGHGIRVKADRSFALNKSEITVGLDSFSVDPH